MIQEESALEADDIFVWTYSGKVSPTVRDGSAS